MAEETKLEPKPKTEKQQAHIDKVLRPRAFKPGESGNPLGRPVGSKSIHSKMLSKLNQVWMRAVAPEDWFRDGLEFLSKKNGNSIDMNIAELITARQAFCLAANIRYQNPQLLKEWYDRNEGKIPLRVVHKEAAEDGSDDYEELSAEELKLYLADLKRRGEAIDEDAPSQPQLPESTAAVGESAAPAEEPNVGPESV
jgi:hypothetical protein